MLITIVTIMIVITSITTTYYQQAYYYTGVVLWGALLSKKYQVLFFSYIFYVSFKYFECVHDFAPLVKIEYPPENNPASVTIII